MYPYTLVPEHLFSEETAHKILSDAVHLEETASVYHKELPGFKAVLVYASPSRVRMPLIAMLLDRAARLCSEAPRRKAPVRRAVFAWDGDLLHIVLTSGGDLLLANTYPARDAVTALYFLLSAVAACQVKISDVEWYHYGNLAKELRDELGRQGKKIHQL